MSILLHITANSCHTRTNPAVHYDAHQIKTDSPAHSSLSYYDPPSPERRDSTPLRFPSTESPSPSESRRAGVLARDERLLTQRHVFERHQAPIMISSAQRHVSVDADFLMRPSPPSPPLTDIPDDLLPGYRPETRNEWSTSLQKGRSSSTQEARKSEHDKTGQEGERAPRNKGLPGAYPPILVRFTRLNASSNSRRSWNEQRRTGCSCQRLKPATYVPGSNSAHI